MSGQQKVPCNLIPQLDALILFDFTPLQTRKKENANTSKEAVMCISNDKNNRFVQTSPMTSIQ